MPNLATLRERRLRMTKAQLIDVLESFERRVAACSASTICATQSRDTHPYTRALTSHQPWPNDPCPKARHGKEAP